MPILIATLIIGGVSGWLASRRVAVIITSVACALTLTAFVYTATDGVGNDPLWIIPEAIVGCVIALALAWFLPARRSRAAAA